MHICIQYWDQLYFQFPPNPSSFISLTQTIIFFCKTMVGSMAVLGRAPPLPPSTTTRYSGNNVCLLHHHPHFRNPLKRSNFYTSKLSYTSINPSFEAKRYRFRPNPCLDSDIPNPLHQDNNDQNEVCRKNLQQWDSLTAKFAGAANVPFLLLQLPQIVLNARNLLAGNNAALFAVPWLGMFTGLLGNLSLLSYFAKKGETEAMVVQTLGVVSTYAVIVQLAMAGSMPVPQFTATSVVVACGLLINFLNYFKLLNHNIWNIWEDFITVAGLSALPQVMWSTFVPYVPNSILPGIISFLIAVVAVVMARIGKLPEQATNFVRSLSGWTATLLFMWMPVAQMWTNFLNPENIRGLSSFSMLLAMTGNGLLIPRALFVKDLMWFTGSCWASFFYGWGNLICMYLCESISKEFFAAATVALFLWIGFALWSDSKAYGHGSPLTSLKVLLLGS
uniref:maltose excess protein 1-like, chloroplastic n=1 Tax=Erigeron canadensis TaxID=72917 RepID=UPI001CB91B98|nr:maltose excess protein 1-like, chloroplastic [Erigeron canadensis]